MGMLRRFRLVPAGSLEEGDVVGATGHGTSIARCGWQGNGTLRAALAGTRVRGRRAPARGATVDISTTKWRDCILGETQRGAVVTRCRQSRVLQVLYSGDSTGRECRPDGPDGIWNPLCGSPRMWWIVIHVHPPPASALSAYPRTYARGRAPVLINPEASEAYLCTTHVLGYRYVAVPQRNTVPVF